MQVNPVIPDELTEPVTFTWNDRTWTSVTDAWPADEMCVYVMLRYLPYDHESAHVTARDGGVFHVRHKYSFSTYYVHKQSAGLRRLFRDTCDRDYCNGQVY